MTTVQAVPARPRVWRNPDFVKYWVAGITSFFGSRLTYVAMPLLVFSLTKSSFLTGAVVAFESVAYLLVGLVAGALADRWQRRRVMVAADVANTLLMGSIPAASALHVLTVGQTFGVAALSGIATVFFDAADFASLPMLVGKDDLASAASILMGPATIIGVVAPGVVGALLTVMRPQTVIGIDAATFAASACLLRALHSTLSLDRTQAARGSLIGDIREGLRYLWGHSTIRAMTIMSFAQSAYGGAALGQFVPLAASVAIDSSSSWAASMLFLAWSAGGFAASVIFPRIARKVSAAWISLIITPVSALGGLLCALCNQLLPLVIVVALWSIIFTVNASNNVVYRQSATPEHLMSRVNATGRMLAWGIGTSLGALSAGLISAAYGVHIAFVAASGFGALAAVIAWASPLRAEEFLASPRER